MWLDRTCAAHLYDHDNDYVEALFQMDKFPCQSFYQIYLDVPRL